MNQESCGYLSLKLVSTLQTHEITNHEIMKLQKTKLFCLHYMNYCMSYFCTKKRNWNILHKHSQNKHLFITHFYSFRFISIQFPNLAFVKIQLQITFAKSFNVLNNAIWSMYKQKFWLVNNFIKFLCKRLITAKEIFLSNFS